MFSKSSTQVSTESEQTIISNMATLEDLQEKLFQVFQNRKAKWKAVYSAHSEQIAKTHEVRKEAELTYAELKNAILAVVNFIKQSQNLNEEECEKLTDGLNKLDYGLDQGYQREWPTTLEHIKLVCKNPRKARKVAEIFFELKNLALDTAENLTLLENASEELLSRFKQFIRIGIPDSSRSSSRQLPEDLKKYLFTCFIKPTAEIIQPNNDEMHAALKLNREKIVANIRSLSFRIKKNHLKMVIDLFNDLKAEDKNAVMTIRGKRIYSEEEIKTLITEINQFINGESSLTATHLVENIFSETDPDNSSISIIYPKHLYFIIRILSAASLTYVKSNISLHGSSSSTSTSEKIQGKNNDADNKALAKQLMKELLGEERATALYAFWKLGLFSPVFLIDHIMRFFSVNKREACGLSAAMQLVYNNKHWKPKPEDLDYLCLYLETHSSDLTLADDIELLLGNLDDDCNSYCSVSVSSKNKHRVLDFANALFWLGKHRIDTVENKDKILQFADHINPLTKLEPNRYSSNELISDEQKQFYQRLLNIVIDHIQLTLKKSSEASFAHVQQLGMFANSSGSSSSPSASNVVVNFSK